MFKCFGFKAGFESQKDDQRGGPKMGKFRIHLDLDYFHVNKQPQISLSQRCNTRQRQTFFNMGNVYDFNITIICFF